MHRNLGRLTVGIALLFAAGVGLVGLWAEPEANAADAKLTAAATHYQPAAGGQLMSHVVARDGEPTALILVDPSEKSVAVYQLGASGELKLKSARQVAWDLKWPEFNSADPAPSDVREAVQTMQVR